MYDHYFTFVCEDCGVRRSCGRGQITAIRQFDFEHAGHNTHINDFAQSGPTLTEFLREDDKHLAAYNRRQKLIRTFSFGKRGRPPVEPWRPPNKREGK